MMESANNSLIGLLKNIWYWLTEPAPSIKEPEHRYQTRLLASLLVSFMLLIVLIILMLILPGRFKPAVSLLRNPDFYLAVGTAVLFAIAYGLNRAGRYTMAAALIVGGLCIGLFAQAIACFAGADPYYDPTDVGVLVYLVLPVFFASVLLPVSAVVIVVAVNVIGILLLPAFFPQLMLAVIVSGPMSFILPMYVLIPLAAHHRNRLEIYRQQEIVRRLEEAEALGTVTTALTRSLDLDQVLQAIVDSAPRLIPASSSGVIHLADEAGRLIPRAALTPEVHIEERLEMSIGEGIAGLVMQEKRLINVPKVEEDPRFLTTDTPIKSLLTAPLLVDGHCIGTLSLNSDQVGGFSAEDERLLTTLAAQAAIAVRNARLYEEVRRQAEELFFLNRIGRTVTSSLDLEQVLTTVIEETALMLKTEAGSILLLDEESGDLVFEAAVGPRSEEAKGLRLPLGQGIAGWVAREGRRTLVSDVREDPRFYSGIDEVTGCVTRSVLAVPMKIKERVIGVIEAVNKSAGYFGQEDVALLSALAQWAAVAIENAQLFAETQRRFEEMAALYNVSLDITARLEMPELLKSIVERAVALLQAKAGGIYLYDSEREELRLAIGYDYTERYVGVTLKPGEGMAGKVLQTGEPLIVDDYRTWEERASVYEADQPFTAALEVPLKWRERITGVLAISADVQERAFNQKDVWLATLFANQAAIAIENARLYKELQDWMEELKRTQAQLVRSAKLAAVGELAAGVAHEINNPLTSIIGLSTLLLRGVADDDPLKGDLEIIGREAARTKTIVRGLLDFVRQSAPRLEPADVNEIVRTTMTLIRHQAKVARVTIEESYDETLPPVLLDTDQMEQVFLNMMTNAIQAMPEGGELKVVTAYQSRARDGADWVAVEVHDTGLGILVEDLPRIFDPFFTTKEAGQGTGLGLSISYSIVERHGGWIEVESEMGRGSTFTVILPVAED